MLFGLSPLFSFSYSSLYFLFSSFSLLSLPLIDLSLKLFVVSRGDPRPPVVVDDCERPGEEREREREREKERGFGLIFFFFCLRNSLSPCSWATIYPLFCIPPPIPSPSLFLVLFTPYLSSYLFRNLSYIPESDAAGEVGQDTRLDNRVIDLRTSPNQSIFRIQVPRLQPSPICYILIAASFYCQRIERKLGTLFPALFLGKPVPIIRFYCRFSYIPSLPKF